MHFNQRTFSCVFFFTAKHVFFPLFPLLFFFDISTDWPFFFSKLSAIHFFFFGGGGGKSNAL